jgi:hypothetical protein
MLFLAYDIISDRSDLESELEISCPETGCGFG